MKHTRKLSLSHPVLKLRSEILRYFLKACVRQRKRTVQIKHVGYTRILIVTAPVTAHPLSCLLKGNWVDPLFTLTVYVFFPLPHPLPPNVLYL